MTYEMDGIKVNCAEGISKEEAAVLFKRPAAGTPA